MIVNSPVRIFVWIGILLASCGSNSSQKKLDRGPLIYKIITPDPLLKQSLMEANQQAQLQLGWPVKFSDSAAHYAFINDSAEYHQERWSLKAGTILIGAESLPEKSTIVLHKTPLGIRLVSRGRVHPWFFMGFLADEGMPEVEEELVVNSNRQTVYRIYKKDGIWHDSINLFVKRKEFENSPRAMGDYFNFQGTPMDYDRTQMHTAMSHYIEQDLARFRPTVRVYDDFETKYEMTSHTGEYSFDLKKNVIHIVNMKLTRTRFCEIISVYYAYQIYGDSFPRLTEGLGIFYSGTFFGKDFKWWKKKQSLLILTDKQKLLKKPNVNENPFLYTYLSVLFWQSQNPVDPVFKNAAAYVNTFQLQPPELPKTSSSSISIPYFKAVCYAHTNGISRGYMSKESKESLRSLKETGVQAISLTPFGYASTATEPKVNFVLEENWDETLGGLFKASDDAHALDMHVMMKPHIWISSGVWCGEIEMKSGVDKKSWADDYSQFVTYHGLIAELAGMESFCIGIEMPKMSRDREMWIRIIAFARAAFSGYMTYGGNWFDEYEHIPFWDQLDFIGVQAYFPLANSEAVPAEDIKRKADEVAQGLRQFSEKWKKPIVFTEVGFPSISSGLIQPHEEKWMAETSEKTQALGYRTILESFGDTSWFRGNFWWKWESANSPMKGRRQNSDKSLHFRNKEAESVIQSYYLK